MSFEPVVAEIMTKDPYVLTPGDRLAIARREMDLCAIRHFPVVDDAGRLVGVLSQRDVLACRDSGARVGDVMSREVLTVSPETVAHQAAYLLVHHKIGCLPVVSDQGLLVGIVTDTDFVSAACVLLGGHVPIDELEREERN
jgi:CBS domain-containing protein